MTKKILIIDDDDDLVAAADRDLGGEGDGIISGLGHGPGYCVCENSPSQVPNVDDQLATGQMG
jgi:hypothetical protein